MFCDQLYHNILILRDRMTHIRRILRLLRSQKSEEQIIFLCLLTGSLAGALSAQLRQAVVSEATVASIRQVSQLQLWLRGALFPLLMAAALIWKSGFLLRLLFVLKGAVISLTVCSFSASGAAALSALFPILLFETLLPLPMLLSVGSVWLEQTETGKTELWLLIPLLALIFLLILLETILY